LEAKEKVEERISTSSKYKTQPWWLGILEARGKQ